MEKQKRRRNIGVILAGGVGLRMGGEVPKQLLPLRGKPVIGHTIEAFERSPYIDEICLVLNAAVIEPVRRLVAQNAWPKVRHILPGGRERSDSSLAAIRAYEDEDCNLLLHDAVRPLVSADLLRRICAALEEHEAVCAAIPSTDTILECRDGVVRSVPDRNSLRRAQTPQAFRREVVARAYEKALSDPDFRATDDCGVVLRYAAEVPVRVVEGEERNLKLTYRGDLPLLEKFMEETV